MFTGIIENLAQVIAITPEGSNIHLDLTCDVADAFTIDQSVAHDGCCLTVVALGQTEDGKPKYRVTAIQETLNKTSLGSWTPGRAVNIERCMESGGRLDGHIVQGHVDCVGHVTGVEDLDGSYAISIDHPTDDSTWMTVPKGSITINGTSLTVVDSRRGHFSVHIIPYTWEHTNFHTFKVGDAVNLEFDIIGKYVARMMAAYQDQA